MNDEEAQKMINVVEEAYKLRLLSYEEYLTSRLEVFRTKSDVERLREKISKLSASIQRLKEVRGK
jgi:polyhydroxyalkanoate synthesis regulator phasin